MPEICHRIRFLFPDAKIIFGNLDWMWHEVYGEKNINCVILIVYFLATADLINQRLELSVWFVVSPAPAGGRPCSPLSLAGSHFCPDCLGCEEPDWRQPSPQPEPEEWLRQLCPWSQSEEEVRWIERQRKDVPVTPVGFKRLGSWGTEGKRLVLVGVKCPPYALSWLTSVAVTSSLGLIYTSRSLAENPQESRRKDATVQRGTRDRMEGEPAPLIWDLTRSI